VLWFHIYHSDKQEEDCVPDPVHSVHSIESRTISPTILNDEGVWRRRASSCGLPESAPICAMIGSTIARIGLCVRRLFCEAGDAMTTSLRIDEDDTTMLPY